jgi:hypothetical protein
MKKFIQVLAVFSAIPSTVFALSYNWKEPQYGIVTRCFPAQVIKVNCEDHTYASDKEKVADLQIEIIRSDTSYKKFSYSYYRGDVSAEICKERLQGIRKLLRGAKQACITGRMESDFPNENLVSARWEAFETHKGRVFR